ncbi:MAG: phosphoglycolate phosphatase [Pseudomonadota bacterium]
MNNYNSPVAIHAVLFDLDGTLIDTAPDLTLALNQLLASKNKPPVSFEEARNHVSQGAIAVTRLGFPEVTDKIKFEQLRQEFLRYYAENICIKSALFTGMAELLSKIEASGACWGIVTNKPGWLTVPLLDALSLSQRAACVISGDTLEKRKPHPDPLLYACEIINLSADNSIYIGDDPRDIYAGNAAGMYTCVAKFGYIDSMHDTDTWGADFSIDHPDELEQHIKLSNPISDFKP